MKSSTWVVNHVSQLAWSNAKRHFKRFLHDCTYKWKLPSLVERTNTNISIWIFITKLQKWAILLESDFSSIHLYGWKVESSAFTPSTDFRCKEQSVTCTQERACLIWLTSIRAPTRIVANEHASRISLKPLPSMNWLWVTNKHCSICYSPDIAK